MKKINKLLYKNQIIVHHASLANIVGLDQTRDHEGRIFPCAPCISLS